MTRADARRNAATLLDAAAAGPELLRAVGNLCIGAERDRRYDARRMVGVLVDGLAAGPEDRAG